MHLKLPPQSLSSRQQQKRDQARGCGCIFFIEQLCGCVYNLKGNKAYCVADCSLLWLNWRWGVRQMWVKTVKLRLLGCIFTPRPVQRLVAKNRSKPKSKGLKEGRFLLTLDNLTSIYPSILLSLCLSNTTYEPQGF